MHDLVLTPTDFVALVNQTLELAYPVITIEGELSSFRVSKNRWVYFDLKDDISSVSFFGSAYQLPGPLEDGMMVRVVGSPRLHPKFGFSVNLQSIVPVGEGTLKKAADLLRAKLEAEGLFAPERKRFLPHMPQSVGLITAADSAAATDFIKIVGERWGGLSISLLDVYVQGEHAPTQLVSAIETFSAMAEPPEVLVITRGGGSADDLAAFNDERVVRAVASSRIPTLVAIGHEVDTSLAELAADARASTPTNAAQVLVPDKKHELVNLGATQSALKNYLETASAYHMQLLASQRETLISYLNQSLDTQKQNLASASKIVGLFDPRAVLKIGYAIATQSGVSIKSVSKLRVGDGLDLRLSDGKLSTTINKIIKAGNK